MPVLKFCISILKQKRPPRLYQLQLQQHRSLTLVESIVLVSLELAVMLMALILVHHLLLNKDNHHEVNHRLPVKVLQLWIYFDFRILEQNTNLIISAHDCISHNCI